MTYDTPTKTGQFLNSLAEGFRQTRLDILLFFLSLVVILLAIVVYFAVRRVAARRELERRSREVLEHLLGRIDLSGEESALLGRLALHLRPDQGPDSILLDHHIFDACARAIQAVEPVSHDLLDALRLKIGFRITQPAETPASTAEIPEGSTIVLVTAKGKRVRGVLRAQSQASLLVQMMEPAAALGEGVHTTAYFHDAGGIYSFPARIAALHPDGVRIDQSDQVVRHQRRRYYRRKESLPVFVKPPTAGGSAVEAVLVDLGGGGASIRCPRGLLKPGDLLEVSFSPAGGNLVLAARVLRLGPFRRVAHVRFESISEAERARILAFLFSQSTRRRSRGAQGHGVS